MAKKLDITEDERKKMWDQRIENGLEFTRDVLDDPTILELIPNESHIEAVFKDQRDPDEHYDIETPRMVAKVIPPSHPERDESTEKD